jgi:hypothetical protein
VVEDQADSAKAAFANAHCSVIAAIAGDSHIFGVSIAADATDPGWPFAKGDDLHLDIIAWN